MSELSVYPEGTEVEIKLGKVKATIAGITIRSSIVLYELMYFSNSEFKYVSVDETYFTAPDNKNYKTVRIGFIPQ